MTVLTSGLSGYTIPRSFGPKGFEQYGELLAQAHQADDQGWIATLQRWKAETAEQKAEQEAKAAEQEAKAAEERVLTYLSKTPKNEVNEKYQSALEAAADNAREVAARARKAAETAREEYRRLTQQQGWLSETVGAFKV